MTKKRESITDAVEILHRRYFEGKPKMLALLEDERAKMAAQLTGADRALVALLGDDGKPHVRGAVRLQDGDDGSLWRGAVDTACGKRGTPTRDPTTIARFLVWGTP